MASLSSQDYCWSSPGGLYVVPDEWRQRFLAEFPDYRVRWSLSSHNWQLEQQCGRGALAPFRIDPADDSLIRARDGYWQVMTFQPGDRMACPAVITRNPLQRCGWTMSVPHRKSAEATCANCRKQRRDGRVFAAYWPFDELLLDHLRYTDPLRDGTRRQRVASDARNQQLMTPKPVDAGIDAVDHRWATGIPSAGFTRRQIDDTTFR